MVVSSIALAPVSSSVENGIASPGTIQISSSELNMLP